MSEQRRGRQPPRGQPDQVRNEHHRIFVCDLPMMGAPVVEPGGSQDAPTGRARDARVALGTARRHLDRALLLRQRARDRLDPDRALGHHREVAAIELVEAELTDPELRERRDRERTVSSSGLESLPA
jgi:hypothetical protein